MNLASKRDTGDAGYFRLGTVVLSIPPEEITTHKEPNDEEVFPLRAKYALHQKTGHSRWDVTLHWKAIAEPGDYSQWEDLRTVLAMFKAAPFVEVENGHLRQIFMNDPESGTDPDARMAFALRMLQISTTPDIPMGLDVTLTMSWFNYLPFSYDFGYLGADGRSAEANNSPDFKRYLEAWKRENLDTPPSPFPEGSPLASKYGYPDMAPWEEQAPGSLKLTWRNYIAVPLQEGGVPPDTRQSPPRDKETSPIVSPRSSRRKAMSALTPPPSIKKIIVDAATAAHVDPYLCLAVSQRESGFNPEAKNPSSSATGLFQLLSGTAKQWNVANPKDPQQNAAGGCKYLGYLLNRYKGDTTSALTAFAAGEGNVDRLGLEGSWNKYSWIPGWLADINSIYTQLKGAELPQPETSKAAASAFKPAPAPAPSVTSVSKTPVEQMRGNQVPEAVIAAVGSHIDEGWSLDHFTDRAVFLYREHEIPLTDEEHGKGPNQFGLYPVQASVVFVNNIAAIPLSGHQYPTYQHVGPAGTMAVIGFASDGVVDGDQEPEHEGLSLTSGMCSALSSQYQRLRGEWRSLASIHRMQAVIVENQVLNMLGVRGATVRGWDTDTVPDSANLVQAHLKLSQYENVFEEIEPFRVKGASKVYQRALDNLMQDGALEKLTKGREDSVFAPLMDYRDKRKRKDPDLILEMLKNSSYPTPPVAMPQPLSQTQLATLRSIAGKNVQPGLSGPVSLVLSSVNLPSQTAVTWADTSPEAAKRIQAGSYSYNDYFLLVHSPGLESQADVAAFRKEVDAQIQAAGGIHPIDRLYDQALDYLNYTGSLGISRALQEVEAAPGVKAALKGETQVGGPGVDPDNAAHGAYRDLGLKTLQLDGRDFNPAYYFVDWGEQHKQGLKLQAGLAAKITARAANDFNRRGGATTATNISGQIVPGATVSDDPAKPLFDPEPAAEAILNRTTLPSLSMNRAFPTFKLFLLEEDNSGPFYMFDDFYSYASVLSIEISKSQNPTKDVAVLRITNFANLLTHRLFDGTSAGRKEKELSNLQEIPSSSNGDAVAGGVQAKGTATKSWLAVTRQDRQGLNLTQGFSNTVDAPLQYYPLQTGAKVQVRMGFSNNPDELWPVFNGKVTQIEGEEVLEIVCQGYGIELAEPAPDMRQDGFSLFGLSGPAYGGLLGFKESGRTESIMECLLTAPAAKHFGHWQIDTARNRSQFIKGFGWIEATAKILGAAGAKNVSRLLSSGFDRRGENISINRYVNLDGSTTDVRLTRGWQYEQPLYIFPAYYHVPKDPSLSPWRVLRDVSRRYSEYVLAVRPYGFPVGADATLVFASPNDVYITRRPLGDEDSADAMLASNTNDNAFREWWHVRGWRRFQALFSDPTGSMNQSIASRVRSGMNNLNVPALQPGNAVMELTALINRDGRPAFKSVSESAVELANNRAFWQKILGMADHAAEAERFRKDVLALVNDLQNNIVLSQRRVNGKTTDPLPADRIQPVRKWHLINQDVIIHNGLRLNGEIFNSVKVNRNLFSSNSSIPKDSLRTLDCDPLILVPEHNVDDWDLSKSYAQSFLRDELGKMYAGELVLAGCPEIEPYDIALLYDHTTGTSGPVEVETVIHNYSPETGFITIIKPRALVIMNDSMTAGIQAALSSFAATLPGEIRGAWQDLKDSDHQAAQSGAALLNIGGQAGMAVGGVMAAKAAAAFLGIGMFTGLPITLAALAGLGAIKLILMAEQRQDALPLFLSPLNRFGKPWVGGLEGWALRDTHSLWKERFNQMYSFEIAPTIEGFRRLNQLSSGAIK